MIKRAGNLTIGKRITAGMGTLGLLLVVVAGVAWNALRQINLDAQYLRVDVMPGTINSAGFTIGQTENFIRTLLYGQAIDTTERKKWKEEMDASSARNSEFLDAYEQSITQPYDRELFAKVQALRADYRAARTDYMKHADAGESQPAKDHLESRLMPAYQTYIAAANEMFQFNAGNGDKTARHISEVVGRALSVITTTSLAALTLAGVVGWLINRGTRRILETVSEQLESGARQTAAAAREVATASQQLAEGATEQAASLEETSASLEEMTSMIKRNAESASKASGIASQTRAAADAGSADMTAMAAAMNDIKASSAEVAKIVKDIDEIAFQTNILALNAAVEAARAGEAGMGFAVVADEVRNLAQRCAHSAQETAAKIELAIGKSERGVEISGRVAAGFVQIAGRTREVDQLVSEIAAASGEQAQGIQQVNQAMTQMDQVTQRTAATAEESASAAEELNAQAGSVSESVGQLQRLVHGHTLDRQPAREADGSRKPASPAKELRGTGGRELSNAESLQRFAEPFQRVGDARPEGRSGKMEDAFTSF